MTIETKVCKPIKDMNFEEIGSIVLEYKKLSDFLDGSYINGLILETTNMDDFLVRYTCEDDVLKDSIQAIIEYQLENLEKRLNILGYTMQEEPKTVEMHVNHLKASD